MAANESRQSPIRIKRSAMIRLRPGGVAAPEEPWCRFVSNGLHRLVAAGIPAPTPCWLTSRAIRIAARSMISMIRGQARIDLGRTNRIACNVGEADQVCVGDICRIALVALEYSTLAPFAAHLRRKPLPLIANRRAGAHRAGRRESGEEGSGALRNVTKPGTAHVEAAPAGWSPPTTRC